MHWEPQEDPATSAWLELREVLRRHPAKLMIWENQPLAATSEALLQLGVATVVFHTASGVPDDGDYFDLMEANIDSLLLQ
jgi:hypothetical protein